MSGGAAMTTAIAATTLHISLDSKIRLHLPGRLRFELASLRAALQEDLILPNPEFHEAERLGRSTRGIPREINLIEWDRATEVASLPRGYWPPLQKWLQRFDISYALFNQTLALPPVNFGSRITLRNYQVDPVAAAVRTGGGIVEAPCGAGKTQMGLEILARIGQPALWLTHTVDLAGQALDRAEQFLGIPRREIGMIGAGRERVGDRLTIALVQTLAQRGDLGNLPGRFGAVLIDEVHHSPASTWQTVIGQFPAHYRYGVTGSLKRADGLERISHLVLGPTVAVVTDNQVKDAGGTLTPLLRVVKTEAVSATWEAYLRREQAARDAGRSKPRLDFGPILDEVLRDPGRNRLIIEVLAREAPGHCSLVLSERVWHCAELVQGLATVAPDLRATAVHGGLAKGLRREIFERARAGELDVIFAVDLAKEGLDIPRLDRLHLVGGGRNAVELRQKVGRIQRALPGKVTPMIFDYADLGIGALAAQWYARRRVYRELGIKA